MDEADEYPGALKLGAFHLQHASSNCSMRTTAPTWGP